MWAIYALLSAFFAASSDPIAKRALSKGSDPYLVGYFAILFSTPFLAIPFISGGGASLSPVLIKTLLAVLPFEIAASILYYKAIAAADISLSVPLLALTPVFTILTGFLLLGESIRPAGALGIALITAGVYSLNIREAKYSLFHPIRAIFKMKGPFYMMVVALIFSFTSVMCKRVLICSGPKAAPFIYNLNISMAMTPLILYRLGRGESVLRQGSRLWVSYMAMGALFALSAIFYYMALLSENVAYVIAIKRLSLLMSVAYGWLLFRERDIHIRALSTACMLLGVFLILIVK